MDFIKKIFNFFKSLFSKEIKSNVEKNTKYNINKNKDCNISINENGVNNEKK